MRQLILGVAAMCVAVGFVMADSKAIKSGPQVGEKAAGPFEPLNITGETAGEEKCLFCRFHGSPTAIVFARNVTPQVEALLTKLDAATVKHSGDFNAFVVFLTEDKAKMKPELEKLSKKWKLKNLVVSTDVAKSVEAYEIHKDADVTVILYGKDDVVKGNHVAKKGELNDKGIEAVVADVAKVLPKK